MKDALRNFLKFELEVVVHAAAVLPSKKINAQIAKEKNELIDKNVFEFCKEHKIKLVFISGASIYSLNKKVLIDEQSLFSKSQNPYILGKRNSDMLLKTMDIESIILRINAPYGPYQNTDTVINLFLNRALKNLPIEIYDKGHRIQDFTYISDISNAINKAIGYNDSDDFIIASGKVISMADLAEKIIKITNSKSEIQSKKKGEVIQYPFFNISKAKERLKWYPKVDINSGLKKIFNSK